MFGGAGIVVQAPPFVTRRPIDANASPAASATNAKAIRRGSFGGEGEAVGPAVAALSERETVRGSVAWVEAVGPAWGGRADGAIWAGSGRRTIARRPGKAGAGAPMGAVGPKTRGALAADTGPAPTRAPQAPQNWNPGGTGPSQWGQLDSADPAIGVTGADPPVGIV